MGRRGFKRQRGNGGRDRGGEQGGNDSAPKRSRDDSQHQGSYKEIKRENEMFEAYYKVQKMVPEGEWDAFMSSLRTTLPATFRITGTRDSAEELRQAIEKYYFPQLADIVIDGTPLDPPRPLPFYPDRLAWHMDFSRNILRRAEPLKRFHQFIVSENSQGNITRQEAVSMIPPLFLDVQPHHKVLDMCAAPGSKTTQLIEFLHARNDPIPTGMVVANDTDNKRCYMLVHQTKRLQSPCFMVTNQDASNYPTLYLPPKSGETEKQELFYDRILCDVPCSGDGTLRKNPIVWTRWTPMLGLGLHRLQTRILERGLQLLAVGGLLVYSTCSFNPVENEAVVAAMLFHYPESIELVDVSAQLPELRRSPGMHTWTVMDRKGNAILSPSEAPPEIRGKLRRTMFPPSAEQAATFHLERCVRILPHQQDTGGFFVAVFRKHASLKSRERKKSAAKGMRVSVTDGKGAVEGQERGECGAEENDSNDEDDEYENGNADTIALDEGGAPLGDDEGDGVDIHVGDVVGTAEDNDDHDVKDTAVVPAATAATTMTTTTTTTTTTTIDTVVAPTAAATEGAKESSRPRGYKEDPFYFMSKDNAHVKSIQEFYGLREDFPVDLFLTRSLTDKTRHIYVVSPLVKAVIESNDQNTLRIINTGVKVFTRSESDAVTCSYRLCQEGINVIYPFMTKRVLPASMDDARTLITRDVVGFRDFPEPVRGLLEQCGEGTCVLNATPAAGQVGCPMPLLGWRGRHTLRCLVAKQDRVHYKVLLGIVPKEEKKSTGEDAPAAVPASAVQDNVKAPEVCTGSVAGEAVPPSSDPTSAPMVVPE